MKIIPILLKVCIVSALILFLVPNSAFAETSKSGLSQDSSPDPARESAIYSLFLPSIAQTPSSPTALGVEMDSVSEGKLLDLANQASVKWVRRNGVLWNE